MKKIRTYSELIQLKSFEERFEYLSMNGSVGVATFGFDRYINQVLYHSNLWDEVRHKVIVRDNGCDLAHEDYPIRSRILIHHMNPISKKDIEERSEFVLNPEYLICTTHRTHNAIHYGDKTLLLENAFIERKPNDTTPWR